MRRQSNQIPGQVDGQNEEGSVDSESELIGIEQLLLRNYDHRWGYDIAVEVIDEEGTIAYEQRYYLQPGQVESVVGVLSDGEYEFRITMDNLQEETLECRIGEGIERMAVVEVGNGVHSLTQGL